MFDRNTMRAIALASQLGFAIACPLLFCAGGGFWLAQEWDTGPWLGFAGLIVGLLAAGGTIYQLAVAIPARKARGRQGEKPENTQTPGSRS